MKKFVVTTAALLFVFGACATGGGGQGYTSVRDFQWRDLGHGIEIRGYIGSNPDVRIPSQIRGTPVVAIGGGAFSNNQLTSVVIPDSVTHIGIHAFENNQLTSVVIPDSVTHIGIHAFSNNQLTYVVIPDSVTVIDSEAFRNNYLTDVSIGSNVERILTHAFANNLLTYVHIPDSVVGLAGNAFADNPLISQPMTVAQRANAAARQEEQNRLAAAFAQAGNNLGGLGGTVWQGIENVFGTRIIVRITFVGDEFIQTIDGLNSSGTFRVAGNQIIFRGSNGNYSVAGTLVDGMIRADGMLRSGSFILHRIG